MAETGWPRVKPILMQVIGYVFLVLGVLGMFLPILQGFLFLFVGLLILARYATWAQRVLDRIRAQHPKFDRMIGQAEAKSHAWGMKIEATTRSWYRRSAAWLRVRRRQVAGWFRSCNREAASSPAARKQYPSQPDP